MFFNDGVKTNMTCALKIRDTQGKGWFKTPNKILKEIKGLNCEYTKEGVILISGRGDPQKIMNLIAKHGDKVELRWMKTGNQYVSHQNHAMYHSGLPPPMPMTMPMTMSHYPPYHHGGGGGGGYYPSPMPYDQYHNYDPQLPYYY